MTKLYLHIGTHKTATSAIQQYMYRNASELKKEGLKVLKHTDLPERSRFRKSKESSTELITKYRTYFCSSLNKKNYNYFLCSEGFSGSPETFYDNNNIVLEMLHAALPKNIELEIIVTFRRQDEFIQSMFSQFKKEYEEVDLNEFLNVKYFEGLDWLKHTERINKIFGEDVKLHVLPYDPELFEKKNILQILGGILNIKSLLNATNLPQRNIGMSKNARKVFDEISLLLNSKYQSRVLRMSLEKVDNKGVGNEYQILSNSEKNEFLKFYNDSNIKLSHRYWQKDYGLQNFSTPKMDIPIENKPTKDLVIKDLLNQIECHHDKLHDNILFRIVNKITR